RCPRILDTDGFAKPVMFDGDDRLCLDGERLVLANGSTMYGTANSEYRTEVEQFDKVTLSGGMNDPTSTFEVRHKSGRRSQYATVRSFPSSLPQIWHLLREFDAQGNCMVYTYAPGPLRQYVGDSENVTLRSILYSGYGNADTATCTRDGSTRTVEFTYTEDRQDKRTTYLYGAASSLYYRLQSIATKVPSLSATVPPRGVGSDGTTVRVYKLAYAVSNATRRSLLSSVQLCAEATCSSDVALPPTVFTYQDDAPRFETHQPLMYYSGPTDQEAVLQPVGSNYRVTLGPDFDGDGTADPILRQLTPRMGFVYLTGTSSLVSMGGDFDVRSDTVIYRDGRAYVATNIGGHVAFAPL